jgi:hypothetical protein
MFNKFRTLFTLLIFIISTSAKADLAIIANLDYQGGELDEEMVRKIFLSESQTFPSGHKAAVANHAIGSPDRKDFFEYVLQMGEVRHKRYWSRKKSIGKKGAPKELPSHKDILNWIVNTPLGITYIDKNMVNDSVKVLLTVTTLKDI